MIKYLVTILVFAVAMNNSTACSLDGTSGMFPENDMYIGTNSKSLSNSMTEDRFNEIVEMVDTHYSPVFKEFGAKLVWDMNWQNGKVNAYASQNGKNWKVMMLGGLARHPLLTEDGFTLAICHEIGHHIGGAPKKVDSWGNLIWASNEGQSDYFASLKCFKRLFENEDNKKVIANKRISKVVRDSCKANYTDKNDVSLCIRSAIAGKSLADTLGSLRETKQVTKFDAKDKKIASKTFDGHPAAQCRLDTYFQGALCDKRISSKVSNTNANIGACSRLANDTVGVRPLCWYKPASN